MAGLPPLQHFRDVPVVPVLTTSRHVAEGGPIWPTFDQQINARHCRNRQPEDKRPATPATMAPLSEPAVWGGYLNLQFGHLIVEQLTRLPQSLHDRPDDLYLFTLPRSQTAETLPPWLWQILDWHGLRRDRLHLVDQPLCAAELRVAAQGEMMGLAHTDAAYLDLLDQNTQRQALVPDPAKVVFVTRAGMVANGQGGQAGEGYLADVLTRAGVRVVDPVQHPVAGQLAIYAGAETLVFSEGSAIHGRLLLGRVAQDIHILRRRPNRDIAVEQLVPRCQTLSYHPTVGRRLGARMRSGTVRYNVMASLYDLTVVFDLFDRLGHDLRPHWDDQAYHEAVTQDLQGWLANCHTAPDQLKSNLAMLAKSGFTIDLSRLPPQPRASH
ncbi:MAG: glycosyltransferase 61 family protein [Paracoccaceae bacterium]